MQKEIIRFGRIHLQNLTTVQKQGNAHKHSTYKIWSILTNMLHQGGYLLTANLLGYEEDRVIWSKLKRMTLETEITPRERPLSTEGTISPNGKIDMLRMQANLNLAFKRTDSPKPYFPPRRVISTSYIPVTNLAKSAAVQRVNTLRKRRLQMSCRAINSLNDLSSSWECNTSNEMMQPPQISRPLDSTQHQRRRRRRAAKSPRESRFRILQSCTSETSSTRSTTSKNDGNTTSPRCTAHSDSVVSISTKLPTTKHSPTLDSTMVSRLATHFCTLETDLETEYEEQKEHKTDKERQQPEVVEDNKAQQKTQSTSVSGTLDTKASTHSPKSFSFAALANTKRVMYNYLEGKRDMKEIKRDSSHLRQQHHSAEVVARIHGFLAEQDISKLMTATSYSRSQLYHHFLRFKALCTVSESPEGINRESFRGGLPSLSVEDTLFVDRVFDVVDSDRRGILDWAHYIHAMASLEQGTAEARTAFLWNVYDRDGGGTISREELKQFFLSSLLAGNDEFVEDVAEIFVEGVFSKITPNESGELTLSEAMRYIETQNEVSDLHGMFGRSMAMQGFAEIIDGTKKKAKNTESENEQIARSIRKQRRNEGNANLLTFDETKVKERSPNANLLINAATNVSRKTRSDSKWSNIDANDREWDLHLSRQYRNISLAVLQNGASLARRRSVVFEVKELEENNDYQRRFGSSRTRRIKPKNKVVQELKPIQFRQGRTSVTGRKNNLLI